MNFMTNILNCLLFLPLLGAIVILFVKKENEKTIKNLAFSFSLLAFILSIFLYYRFNPSESGFDFVIRYSWLKELGISYYIAIDGLSLMLILLTTFLMPISILSSYEYIKKNQREYYFWLLVLETAIIGVFCAMDMFLFYIFWEAMLIPMYFIIGIWGGENKIYATLKFFIYTMAGSLFMLVSIIFIYYSFHNQYGYYSFDIFDLYKTNLTGKIALFSFFSFLIAFAIKVPIFPFHTWLPDAHVEAPTAGSVILAGILLKMGIYGYIRFLIPLFPQLSYNYAPYIAIFGVIGVIYSSLVAWVQKDIKKMIAYSSIAHLGLIILGVFSFRKEAVSGAILQMLNHGLSTGALFLLIGVLYERRHTRLIESYGGIFKTAPYYSSVFMLITLSSIALPGLNGFIGEFLIFIGSFKQYSLLTFISLTGMILSAIYMLTLYEKVFFGPIKLKENEAISDLKIREWLYLIPLIFFIVYIGLKPQPFLNIIDKSTDNYIGYINAGARK